MTRKKNNLDEIRRELEGMTDGIKCSFESLASVKENRKEVVRILQLVKDKLEWLKQQTRVLIREREKKNGAAFLTDTEYRKLYKRKAIVFFDGSDFRDKDEYIDAMRRPLISKEEADAADWDEFLTKLSKWKGYR